MHFNFIHYDISSALSILMRNVLEGTEQGSRNGRTKELAHVGVTLREPWRREILLPERKANLAAQIAETAWVLAGRNDLEFLNHYLPRAKDFSDDGTTWRGGYGPRIRSWAGYTGSANAVDQLQHVVDLLRENPLERRAVIGIYDAVLDAAPGKDVPCNDFLMFTNRLGKLDMQVVIRSNDLMWGWSGINAFEWSVLQEIVAGMIGVQVGALHFSIASLHLYQPYWDKADRIAKLGGIEASDAERLDSPRFNATGMDDTKSLDFMLSEWFELEARIREGGWDHPSVREDVDQFAEPMFQSWLRVLQWWWSGDVEHLAPLAGTRLHRAAEMAMQPNVVTFGDGNVMRGTVLSSAPLSDFLGYAVAVHIDKHRAYKDSWKRRGEMLGIMANIARKVDRLGGSETADETSADTAMDLMVYLAKYHTWISDQEDARHRSDDPDRANDMMVLAEQQMTPTYLAMDGSTARSSLEKRLRTAFDDLEVLVTSNSRNKHEQVWAMLCDAYVLARYLWEASDPDQYQGADAD